MRRTLSALLIGAAVSVAGLIPAGALDAPEGDRGRRHLRLDCQVARPAADTATEDTRRGPAVACDWSPAARADLADVAGYRLFRAQKGGHRQVIYRGGSTSFVDADVRPGGRYAYKVQSLGPDGRTRAWSDVVVVNVPESRGRLRLACEAADRPAVTCTWSPSDRPDAAGYRLWRGGGDPIRTIVYRGEDTTFVDTGVEPGHRYRYLVQALNADGRVIGASDVVKVAVPGRVVPGPWPEPAPQSRPEREPVPTPEPKPQPRPEPAPEPAPEPRPEPMPLPTPEPKPLPEPRPGPAPKPAPESMPRPEPMKLECRVAREAALSDSARPQPAVACRWSALTGGSTEREAATRDVAGYRLFRAERNSGRTVIFRSRTETSHLDTTVSAGNAYAYYVEALDSSGRVIGHSDVVKVDVPAPAATGNAA